MRERWEAIKAEQEGREGVFHDVPESLPALLLARKVQRRAAAVGYDWPDLEGPVAKVREETAELLAELGRAGRPAPESEPDRAVEAELGDLLFTVVNIARYVNHACRPNCYTDIDGRTIWILAARRIRKGEELTYDYNTDGDGLIECQCRPGCQRLL